MIELLLAQQSRQLDKQRKWLEHSLRQCRAIGIKEEYTVDEYGAFETLGARFGRTIDFLVRKLYRTLDRYEFEDQGSLIDTVNRAHKRGLFDDIERLREMKDLRNTLVHEYVEEKLAETFEELLEYTPELLEICDRSLDYIRSHLEPKK